jgi:pectinesterase inhibitor-like protein
MEVTVSTRISMAIQRTALFLTLVLFATGNGGLAVGTPSALITKTCAAAYNFSGGVSYDYCVGALSADPSGASAKDIRELAVVAANLTAANVTATVLVLADLVHNLKECLDIYRVMSGKLAAALEDFRAGHNDAASHMLREASDMPDNCDILLFEGSAKKNPMYNENVDAYYLSHNAHAISMEVLHPPPRS